MSDYFFKTWASEKADDWANEAQRDELAALAPTQATRAPSQGTPAPSPGRPAGRVRVWFGRVAHACRARLQGRPAEL